MQNKQDYQLVSDHFLKRIAKIAEKNQGRLQREIQESGELSQLLNKSKTNELTDEEKEQMRRHLIELLKTVPTLVIISLPQKFLTLPMLLKVLPKSVFEKGKG
ncbi:MAG: hypothetical protein ACK57K_04755 [Chryseotalea sp.]